MARYIVVEFKGKGDPYFGGSADDRPLGKSGAFLTGCYLFDRDVAVFESEAAALAAGEAAERREGSILGAFARAPRDGGAP